MTLLLHGLSHLLLPLLCLAQGICPTIGPSAFRRIIGSVAVVDDAFGQTVPNAALPCPILVLGECKSQEPSTFG
ncbi:hypothetical protein V8C34DRAFT_10498 [Trichoderma compactum]